MITMAKATKHEMSKEMIDNIKNYGSEIKTLKDFVTSVRKTPGMYIGGIGDPGFINMIREVVHNSLDELNKKSSPCDTVSVTYDERSFTTIVEDNGRGIPFNNIIRIFENQHTSSNYDKKPGEYSSGLHGVGAKVTNALSKKFIVESFVLGEGRKVEFDDGYPWKKGEAPIKKPDIYQGTRITFQPQLKVLGDLGVTWERVLDLLDIILPLNTLNAVINYTGIDSNGKPHKNILINKAGIMTYIVDDTTKPLIKPIHLFKDTGFMKADIMFTYNIEDDGDSHIHAFCNFCPTADGTHIDGMIDGISEFFVNYMNKKYLATADSKKKNKVVVNKADVKNGLCAVIAAASLEPKFAGQSKERLTNEEMKPFVKNMVLDELDNWSKENPADFLKICKYLKGVAELRMDADKKKVKLNKQFNSSALTGLPSKFIQPIGKKDLELWICEGDSAIGAMRNNRNNQTQGLFPIRGKLPNALNWKREEFLSNEEVAGIISIIFDGYPGFNINKLGKKSFKIDVSKIKYKKIIFGTDADPDGKHIDKLLMVFFLVYMPELIEAGMVYEAKPPLYGIRKNGKISYLNDRTDYVEYTQKFFSKKYSIAHMNGKNFTPSELSKLLYKNIDYTYELEKISGRYSLDGDLLESVLLLRNESHATIKKKLKKVYKFLNFTEDHGTLIIGGAVGDYINTIFFNERFLLDCKPVIDILSKNKEVEFLVNGKVYGLYGLMKLYDTSKPNIERYKGLGEMEDAITAVMDSDTRVLIQYTIHDAKKTLDKIRYYENNINELIGDIKVSRFDVMD